MLKLKQRFSATRFDFQLHIHTLQPWPAGDKAIAIGWQRGKRRRGATASVLPAPTGVPGGATVVRFNERINFKSTLYKAPGAAPDGAGGAGGGGALGPFKRKCVILAVLETDGRTHATAALGRVVIDLAEFATIDGQELRTFTVACSKAVRGAVGADPQLTITLRCRWGKAGADFNEDEAASMSTDQSGSSLGFGGNLRDFFSFGRGGGGGSGGGSGGAAGAVGALRAGGGRRGALAREQDLGGFGGGGGGGGAPMEAIGEDDGTPSARGGGGGGGAFGGGGGGGRLPRSSAGVHSGAFGSPRRPRESQDVDEADWEGAANDYPIDGAALTSLACFLLYSLACLMPRPCPATDLVCVLQEAF